MSAWRGPLALENTQTGDGRIIAPGAIEWDDGPLPLAYRVAGDQHVDTITDAPQVGTIDRVWRDGDIVMGEGVIDDDNVDGAELVRRLSDGTASHGNRQGVSIDPDNWQIEVWAVDSGEDEDDELLLTASGSGRMLASAGDPDDTDGRVLLMEDASDQVLSRMTRLRLRGATAVAVPAFSGAYIELVGADTTETDEEPTDAEEPPDGEVVADATLVELPEDEPPAEWFFTPEPDLDSEGQVDVYGKPAEELLVAQSDGGFGVPLEITPEGRVFGHAARWGQCHIGYPNTCVTAPQSPSGYAQFHIGQVKTSGFETIATGPVTMSTDHAAASLRAADAIDHYAHTGLAWADVRLHDGQFGIWMSGRVRPGITPDQVASLSAGGVSGDWRTIPHGSGPLEMIGLLAVNTPGFGIERESSFTASAHVVDGVQTSLTAAGIVERCPNCGKQHANDVSELAALLAELVASTRRNETRTKQIELRTRHLIGPAAEHAMRRINR